VKTTKAASLERRLGTEHRVGSESGTHHGERRGSEQAKKRGPRKRELHAPVKEQQIEKKVPFLFRAKMGVWVYLQFSGGLETLFDNVKSHKVEIPSKRPDRTTVKSVISYIQKKMLKKQPEMFLKEKELRPGILVLINDIDWELG